MLKISCAGCPGTCIVMLMQCTSKCASQSNIAKKSYHFNGLRSFKVIDISTFGKLVSSACYDKQQVCASVQLFSR